MKFAQIKVLGLLIVLVFGMIPNAVFAEAFCDVFTVTPTTAAPGDFVTLDWSTTNTISVDIDALGTVATSGSALYEVPNTPGLVTINLTAFDENVSEPIDANCSVDLTIAAAPICDLFLASPSTIDGPGNVGLEWLTTGADTVTIDNGVGFVAEDGDQIVSVASSTTYTLTAANSFGTTTCAVPVTVNAVMDDPEPTGGSNGGGGKSINPRCEVSVDKPEVFAGDTVIVSWQSTNATALSLTATQNGQSNPLLNGTSSVLVTSGSYPVVVSSNTTFTVDVTRPNRSGACEASVVVKPDPLSGAGAGDSTGLISLTSVPATGFDPTVGFIILLNAFLVFGAATGAYVLVTFSHQYKRATDRSFTNTHVFTPLHALFSQERRSLHSRIILWKWLAVILAMTSVTVLFLIR